MKHQFFGSTGVTDILLFLTSVKQTWGQGLVSLVPELGHYKALWRTNIRSTLVGGVKIQRPSMRAQEWTLRELWKPKKSSPGFERESEVSA